MHPQGFYPLTSRMEARGSSHCTENVRVSETEALHYMNEIEDQALISKNTRCSPASMVTSKAATLVDAEMQQGCGILLGRLRWGARGHACMCGYARAEA